MPPYRPVHSFHRSLRPSWVKYGKLRRLPRDKNTANSEARPEICGSAAQMKSFAGNVKFAANAFDLGRYLDVAILQFVVRYSEGDTFGHGFVVDDALEGGSVGPNGVRPRASAAGPYKSDCGHQPRGTSRGRSRNGLAVFLRFGLCLLVFQQGVILSRHRPRGLNAWIFP